MQTTYKQCPPQTNETKEGIISQGDELYSNTFKYVFNRKLKVKDVSLLVGASNED